jgi:hypothetical protein
MIAKGFDADTYLTDAIVEAAMVAGCIAAGRYLKNLQPAEVAVCARHGFKLWLIYEGMGDLATIEQGAPRGQKDGALAKSQALALGAPTTIPIFAAVDFGATGGTQIADVDAYMGGFASGCAPYPQGDYGDGDVILSRPNSKGYVAGADGWSKTEAILADPPANLAIVQHAPANLYGINVDPCDILDESVLWAPTPGVPKPTTITTLRVGSSGAPVAALQDALTSAGFPVHPDDGDYGPATKAAVEAYQTAKGLAVDGVAGPDTLGSLGLA